MKNVRNSSKIALSIYIILTVSMIAINFPQGDTYFDRLLSWYMQWANARSTMAEGYIDQSRQERTHVVIEGDYLRRIAAIVYGDENYWILIRDANRDLIPNPDFISPGTVLRIPPLPER